MSDDNEITSYGNSYIYLDGEYTIDELDNIVQEARKRHAKYAKMLKRDIQEADMACKGKKKSKGK